MEAARFVPHDAPGVREPVFVEGLPGVGHVGKLAAEHLVDVTGAKPWFDIFSHDFPPQVTVQPDGTVRLVRNQLWVAPRGAGKRDLVIMTGDHQPMSSHGQYAVVEGVLDHLDEVGCRELYTLGGYGLGTAVESPGVLGAATDAATVKRLRAHGVQFNEDEPPGGIIGASGLFLGLGATRGLRGACLMGETSGYTVDPRAAEAVLRVLGAVLDHPFDLTDLGEKAREVDHITRQVRDAGAPGAGDADLNYIG